MVDSCYSHSKLSKKYSMVHILVHPREDHLNGEHLDSIGAVIVTMACITKVIISYVAWNSYRCLYVGDNARTFKRWIACSFIICTNKSPNVLTRSLTMSKTHFKDIWLVNIPAVII